VFTALAVCQGVFGTGVLQNTPTLQVLYDTMLARANIAAYLKSARFYSAITLSPAESQVIVQAKQLSL
jgi:hypothetical protein